jgi:hypothetical protein
MKAISVHQQHQLSPVPQKRRHMLSLKAGVVPAGKPCRMLLLPLAQDDVP